jgi:hypothetical protein
MVTWASRISHGHPKPRIEQRGYHANSSWIRLILSHHEEHEDHKEKTHKFTFILSCPSWLAMFHLHFLHNHIEPNRD